MKKYLPDIICFTLLLAAIVLGRTLVHAPNFTPVAAAAIFGGFLMRSRILAFLLPFFGMLFTDVFFEGTYDFGVMAFVYVAMMLPVAGGFVLRKPLSEKASGWKSYFTKAGSILLVAGSSSIAFFVLSNLAHWMFTGMYAYNFNGLMLNYAAAIPFLKFNLLGDFFYTFCFFGAFFFVNGLVGSKTLAKAKI